MATVGVKGLMKGGVSCHAGPAAWNCLSAELRRPDLSITMFRRLLKNSLFTAAYTLTVSALGAMR